MKAGFTGSNLVRCLVRDDRQLTVLDSLSFGHSQNLTRLSARLVEGDIRNPDAVAGAMQELEVVFRLAASAGNKRSIDCAIQGAEINVVITVRLLDAVRQAGVRKVVASSSVGIFGELKTLAIREDHPIDPDTPYAASKKVLAYGNVIDVFVFRMLFEDGQQTREVVHVKDAARANLGVATPGVRWAFNIGCWTRFTINELVRRLNVASGMAPAGEYRPSHPEDVQDSPTDISSARRTFGFAPPVGLDAGLRENIARDHAEVTHHVM